MLVNKINFFWGEIQKSINVSHDLMGNIFKWLAMSFQ